MKCKDSVTTTLQALAGLRHFLRIQAARLSDAITVCLLALHNAMFQHVVPGGPFRVIACFRRHQRDLTHLTPLSQHADTP